MKCLSLRQPWAWIVLYAGKHLENRRWSTHYRGPLLLHAAKAMTRREYEDALDFADGFTDVVIPKPAELLYGGIVGRARVVNMIAPCTSATCEHPWHIPGQYGWVLRDVEPLPFVPMKGHLGLFDVRWKGPWDHAE